MLMNEKTLREVQAQAAQAPAELQAPTGRPLQDAGPTPPVPGAIPAPEESAARTAAIVAVRKARLLAQKGLEEILDAQRSLRGGELDAVERIRALGCRHLYEVGDETARAVALWLGMLSLALDRLEEAARL